MSRGLGKLQRQILEHLEDPLPAYEGTGMSEARVYGADCILGDGIYDLRWVSKRVWRKLVNSPATMRGRSGMDGDRSRAYDAAFSRAVKGLVKRRILWPLDTVPLIVTYRRRNNSRIQVEEVEKSRFNSEPARNGELQQWECRQVRFVKFGSAHPKFKKIPFGQG